MQFVSPWTILYGVIGSACFWASIRRGDRQSFFYGGMLMVSWPGAGMSLQPSSIGALASLLMFVFIAIAARLAGAGDGARRGAVPKD